MFVQYCTCTCNCMYMYMYFQNVFNDCVVVVSTDLFSIPTPSPAHLCMYDVLVGMSPIIGLVYFQLLYNKRRLIS